MLLNAGRLLMLLVWSFLLWNIIQPYPKPLKYFIDIALFFMVVMHCLQLMLLKATQPKQGEKLSKLAQVKIFFFGVFELLALQKQQVSEGKRHS